MLKVHLKRMHIRFLYSMSQRTTFNYVPEGICNAYIHTYSSDGKMYGQQEHFIPVPVNTVWLDK
jgi:hypothetical protein